MDISIVETDDKYLYELHGQHLAVNCTLGKVKDCKIYIWVFKVIKHKRFKLL